MLSGFLGRFSYGHVLKRRRYLLQKVRPVETRTRGLGVGCVCQSFLFFCSPHFLQIILSKGPVAKQRLIVCSGWDLFGFLLFRNPGYHVGAYEASAC